MQAKMLDATREDQHSLAPIQLEATGLERDLAAFKRGQGKRMSLALLGSALTMAGLLLWMGGNDDARAYGAAARHLESLYSQPDPAFAQCALLQPQASQQALRSAIEAASQTYGKAYEQQLAPCSRALVVFERELAEMDLPMSMEHRFQGLRHAANALNRAIGSYRSYLFDPNRPYDRISASSHIDNVVTAWSNYEVQRHNTTSALREAAQTRSN